MPEERQEGTGQQPDPAGTETAPVAPAFENQPSEDAEPQQPPQQEPVAVDPENAPANVEQPEPEAPAEGTGTTEGEETPEGGGVLVGTASEQAPGVGGLGDHPAPAAMVDPESGQVRVAGQPPHAASSVAPTEESDVQAGGDVTDEEAREKLNAVQEPEQVETERPDIGTE